MNTTPSADPRFDDPAFSAAYGEGYRDGYRVSQGQIQAAPCVGEAGFVTADPDESCGHCDMSRNEGHLVKSKFVNTSGG